MFLIFLGAPGAGKGTQAAVVAEKTKLAHIATGDLFRAAVKNGTELGKLAQGYMQQGKLVPDEVTIGVIKEKLESPECAGGAIFDGFPRTIEQAKALDNALAEMGKKVDRVISIDVPDSNLLKRLGGRWTCQQCQTVYHEVASPPKVPGVCDKCGGKLYQRADDNETTIKERLKVYHAQTAPLLDYYKGKIVNIDGTVAIENVTNQILKALGK